MIKRLLTHQLKGQAVRLEQDLMGMVTDLIDTVSREKDVSPYGLSLLFKVTEDKLIGQVITKESKELYCFHAGAMFTHLLEEQMKVAPAILKNQIIKQLEGEQLEELLVSMLQKDCLLIRYNTSEKLEIYQITATNSELINLQDFFENIEW
jgi:hypothetical protein